MVAGAPVCREKVLLQVAQQWEFETESAKQKVCYFGAGERLKEQLAPYSEYSIAALGAQPVWNPAHWQEIIRSHSSLRAQLNRARNKGVVVTEWPSARANHNQDLERILREWLQTRGLPPLHFLVEPMILSFMEDRRTFVAQQDGKVIGFTVLAPIPDRNGWLTEMFPRGFDAPNGTVELLMNVAISTVAAEGADYVTMGLVPLSEHGRDADDENPLWLKVLFAWARAHGRRFYNFDGLEHFKAKFIPDYWEAIYAISHERHFSPRSLYAIAAAFTDQPPWKTLFRGLAKALRQEILWIEEGLIHHKNE